MTSEVAKTIASCTIWICTATILTFGLYRMNADVNFFAFTTIVIVSGATISTGFVWRRPRLQSNRRRGFEVVAPAQPIESEEFASR